MTKKISRISKPGIRGAGKKTSLSPSAYGYDAATPSANRGYIYWPSLNPRQEINAWSRYEVARKVHYLCALQRSRLISQAECLRRSGCIGSRWSRFNGAA